jgi:thiamine-phosphate pyrophosphorylase
MTLQTPLYLVTDAGICQRAGHTVEFVVTEACRAGVRLVQLREKELSTRAFIEQAFRIKAITRHYGATLIINDRVDVALAIDADGVHIGQDDMPYTLARQLLGKHKIIGLSVNNPAELQASLALDVDYWGIATIFATPTKTDTGVALGLETLVQMCQQTALPTYAIGGIQLDNAQSVRKTGVTGVAVVSAICGAASPFEATQHLFEQINV